jgi:D-lactate dehydrogenase
VYVPACINRIFGSGSRDGEGVSLPQAMVSLSARAGQPVWIPPEVAGHCCGTPWSSKGYDQGARIAVERMRGALGSWSDGGRLPVVLDASSCSQALHTEVELDGVQVLDSIAWVHDHLLPGLSIQRKLRRIVVHPTCATRHLGLVEQLVTLAEAAADETVVPASSGCCGMAGDRGWLHPELPASALRDTAAELSGQRFDVGASSNRTCELALEAHTGQHYESIVQTLAALTG